MANEKTRLYNLPEVTAVNNDMYLMLDSSTTGARKYNLKTFYDKVDGVQASAQAATTAATAATAAAESANTAATAATEAATSAGETVAGLVEDVDEALDAIGDILELAVPLMSATTRGGAKLGTGLEITDGTLSVNTTASGDGSTAGPILSLSAKGWAEQASTTGKNLLQLTLPNNAASITANGVTFTNLGDRVMVVGTTNAANTFVNINYTGGVTIPAGEYIISGGTSAINMQMLTNSGVVASVGATESRFTIPSGITESHARIQIPNSGTAVNVTIFPMIRLASGSDSTYEPYTGGAPSPSPDYPQEIRVCNGRNLLDESTLKTGLVDSNGNLTTTTTDYVRTEKIPCDPSSSYVAQTSYASNRQLLIYEWSSDGSYLGMSGYSKLDEGTVLAFETKATAAFVCVVFRHMSYPAVVSDFVGGCQLTLGSTPQPYVPYGYVGMEVHGKNLFDESTLRAGDLNGANTTTRVSQNVSDRINVTQGEKYTVSGTLSSAVQNVFVLITDDSNSFVTNSVTVTTLPYTYNVTASGRLAFVFSGANNGGTWSALTVDDVKACNLQLEKGSTATSYEPHIPTTPIPLPSRGWVASLPDGTADTLTLDGAGKVTWIRKTNEITFDGSEASGRWMKANNHMLFSDNIFPAPKAGGYPAFANRYRNFLGLWADMSDGEFFLSNNSLSQSNKYLAFTDDAHTSDVDTWQTWLSTHPVTVLYPLATPVIEERGYVKMPSVPVGAELRIPELDDLGVRYCVDDAASELARMWYGKAKSEYANELAELRMTVNELATRIN